MINHWGIVPSVLKPHFLSLQYTLFSIPDRCSELIWSNYIYDFTSIEKKEKNILRSACYSTSNVSVFHLELNNSPTPLIQSYTSLLCYRCTILFEVPWFSIHMLALPIKAALIPVTRRICCWYSSVYVTLSPVSTLGNFACETLPSSVLCIRRPAASWPPFKRRFICLWRLAVGDLGWHYCLTGMV